jgi:replicative DNA helicase
LESPFKDIVEAQFISILMDNPEYSKLVPLEPEDFVDPRNGLIFKTIRDMLGQKLDVTPITIIPQLEQCGFSTGIDYLERVYDISVAVHDVEAVKARAGKIREGHIRREMIKKLERSVESLANPTTDLQDEIGEISEVLTEGGKGLLGRDDPTVDEIIKRAHSQTKGIRFPSGLLGIDANLTAHGMRHGHVWTILAPYKGWKTAASLNIVNMLLENGRSVSYVALEDNDIAFTEVLTALHSGVPLHVIEDFHVDKVPPPLRYAQALQDAEDWLSTQVQKSFRVYDAKYGVHNWKTFSTMVALDKQLYNTDVVVVDYLQAWSEDHEGLSQVAQMLVKVAAEHQVCLLVLSQMSNDSIKNGTGNMLATKGSGSIGQATHVGIEIKYDREKCWGKFDKGIEADLLAAKVQHFLSYTGGPGGTASDVVEIGLWLKTVRRGKVTKTYLLIDPVSQKVILQSDSPRFMEAI